MKNKRHPATILCLFVLLLIVASSCRPSTKGEMKPVTIGAIFPLSGVYAQYGNYWREGVEIALDDAIASGLVKKDEVRLVLEDGEANPGKSVAAFQKLLIANKPIAVIPGTSGVILAIKPVANREHVVLINASAISPEIEDADDYCFSILPDATVEAATLADFAFSIGKKSVGVLYRNDSSGKAFHDAFKERMDQLGGNIPFQDSHNPNEQDYRSYILKLKSRTDLDALFVASFGPEVATYLKQAAELGLRLPVLAYTTFNSPKVFEIAGASAEGVCFSAPAFDASSGDTVAKQLQDRLFAKYGQKESNYHIAMHYDAMMLLLTGISKSHCDGESLKTYIAGLKSFDGKSGRITFGKNGSGKIPLRVYTIEGGRVVIHAKSPK
jgi:branched-chain amino acid transport system substrate-binding protein